MEVTSKTRIDSWVDSVVDIAHLVFGHASEGRTKVDVALDVDAEVGLPTATPVLAELARHHLLDKRCERLGLLPFFDSSQLVVCDFPYVASQLGQMLISDRGRMVRGQLGCPDADRVHFKPFEFVDEPLHIEVLVRHRRAQKNLLGRSTCGLAGVGRDDVVG